jgi:hypothetical protein
MPESRGRVAALFGAAGEFPSRRILHAALPGATLSRCGSRSTKRARTLAAPGLDFADAALFFAGLRTVLADDRRDYGEPRYTAAGYFRGRLVVPIWTPRGDARRVIAMRHAHAKEEAIWRRIIERS